jgi:hypothetical protein
MDEIIDTLELGVDEKWILKSHIDIVGSVNS